MTKATEAPKKTYRFRLLRGSHSSGSKRKGTYKVYSSEGHPSGHPFIVGPLKDLTRVVGRTNSSC